MAKSKSELRKWLDGIAVEAADQTRLYDSSINKLYHCMSSLYMWWREAKQYEGFLDELYEEFNITTWHSPNSVDKYYCQNLNGRNANAKSQIHS